MIDWKKQREKRTKWFLKTFDLKNEEKFPKWTYGFVKYMNESFFPTITNIVIAITSIYIFTKIFNAKGFENTIIIMLSIIIMLLRIRK